MDERLVMGGDHLIVGIDLAHGPDYAAFALYDPLTKRYTHMGTLGQPPVPGAPKLSTDSANTLYETIRQLDRQIDNELRVIAEANRQISTAHSEINEHHMKREELAAELDKFAAEDWTPPAPPPMKVGYPVPPAWNPPRFRRPHPLAVAPEYGLAAEVSKRKRGRDEDYDGSDL